MPAEPRRVTVTLELEASAEPIRGVARDADGAERPFTGWLGLARALELTLDEAVDARAESRWR